MQRVNKLWKLVLLVSIMSLVVIACNKTKTDTVEPGESVGPVNPADPTELIVYNMTADSAEYFNSRFGDAVRKKFPNYKITYLSGGTGSNQDRLMKLVLDKTPVDLVFAAAGWLEMQLFQYDYAYDMKDLIKKHNVDLSQFDPAFNELLGKAYGGSIYFLPVQSDVPLLFYNKAIFDRFGVPYPKNGMTWDEMYDIAQRLTRNDGGVKYTGFMSYDAALYVANQLSIPLLKSGTLEPTINVDNRWKTFFEEYFGKLSSKFDKGYFKGLSFTKEFYEGRLAMTILQGANFTSSKKQLELLNFDVVSLPVIKEQPNIGFGPMPVHMAVANTSRNKDAAMEVLKYIVSTEVQSGLSKQGMLPVLKDTNVRKLLGTESDFKDKNWSSAFFNPAATFVYYGPILADIRTIYIKYSNQVLYGETDINTALRMAEEEAKKKVDELKGSIRIKGL